MAKTVGTESAFGRLGLQTATHKTCGGILVRALSGWTLCTGCGKWVGFAPNRGSHLIVVVD